MITSVIKRAAQQAYDELIKNGFTQQSLRKAGVTKVSLEIDITIASCNRESMPMATIVKDVVADVKREMIAQRTN